MVIIYYFNGYYFYPYISSGHHNFFTRNHPTSNAKLVPALTPYGWVYVLNVSGKIPPREHIYNSEDFNRMPVTWWPSHLDLSLFSHHKASLKSGTFNIPTSIDDLVGVAKDSWIKAEDNWHRVWGDLKGRLKVQLPKADRLGMQGKTPVGFKQVAIWGGAVDKFVKAELYEATESAKRQAREAYNNLRAEAKSKVYDEWSNVQRLNRDLLNDTYEKFLKRLEELALEAYEALLMMKNLLTQIRNIQSLAKPCPDGLYARHIPIFKVDVPIIEKRYALSFKVCYPLNLFPNTGDLINDLIGHLQKKSEDKVEQSVLYAVTTTGFSGILAGLQIGINESLSNTPTWIEEWARNKADQTAQNAKNSVQLKIDFSEV
ncbi:hypothetical protein [Priestia megaterium]|uniref:hypothetical protein n=1 Tax=Priestia megaterium TaxID=1404 RepID=UPI001865CD6E|nr:hypothetical protein [Priestia megaterium]MBE2977782.1 hypothetical protein [Priestia megaterium]